MKKNTLIFVVVAVISLPTTLLALWRVDLKPGYNYVILPDDFDRDSLNIAVTNAARYGSVWDWVYTLEWQEVQYLRRGTLYIVEARKKTILDGSPAIPIWPVPPPVNQDSLHIAFLKDYREPEVFISRIPADIFFLNGALAEFAKISDQFWALDPLVFVMSDTSQKFVFQYLPGGVEVGDWIMFNDGYQCAWGVIEEYSFSSPVGYRLLANGRFSYTPQYQQNVRVFDTSVKNNSTDVGDLSPALIPSDFHLEQNYPNPFNPQTTIEFNLDTESPVELIIFDLVGRQVARLVDGTMQAGNHSVHWSVQNMPSGIYIYRLQVGNQIETRRMLLLK